MAKNTVLLKGDLGHRYEEALAGGTIKPAHLGKVDPSTEKIVVHDVVGGVGPWVFPIEDGLQGRTIADAYSLNELCRYIVPPPGAVVQGRLKLLENVVKGDKLISGGDGTLIKAASMILANALTDSAAVTSSSAETTFTYATATNGVPTTGSVSIPAGTLQAGDRIRVRARGLCTATNSTDTLTVKVKVGGNIIASTGAVDPANNDIFLIQAEALFRTVGSSGVGTVIGSGTAWLITPGASQGAADVGTAWNLESTAIDTTAAIAVIVTGQWSSTNTGNSCKLSEFVVEVVRGTSNMYSAVGNIVAECTEDTNATAAEQLVPCMIV